MLGASWRKCPDCNFDYQSDECPDCAIDASRREVGRVLRENKVMKAVMRTFDREVLYQHGFKAATPSEQIDGLLDGDFGQFFTSGGENLLARVTAETRRDQE